MRVAKGGVSYPPEYGGPPVVKEPPSKTNPGSPLGEDLPAESVRAQLERMLASTCFIRATRPSRLLRFVAEKSLLGEAEKIKEYVLGVEVLGRKDSFDPQVDAIVRVEAGRLRKKLDEYYQTDGRDDPILIELPKGRYTPVFRKRQGPLAEVPRRPWRARPLQRWQKAAFASVVSFLLILILSGTDNLSGQKRVVSPVEASELVRNASRGGVPLLGPARASIAVLPFADLSPHKDQEYFTDGLTEELTGALTRVPGLRVVSRTSAFQYKEKPQDVRAIGKQLDASLVLEGSVRRAGRQVRITAQLVNAMDGYHIWADTYDGDGNDVLALQSEVAKAVTGELRTELARVSGPGLAESNVPLVRRAGSPPPR